MQLTFSPQRDLSSPMLSWCPSTVSLTTSTTRPSAGTLTSGTERRDELAPIGRCDFAASQCSSPAASTSSPALSLSAALQKRPGKVRAGINVLFSLVPGKTFVSFQLHLLFVPSLLSFIHLFCFMHFHFIIDECFLFVLPKVSFYCFFTVGLILKALYHISN